MQKHLINPEGMVKPLSKYSHGVKVQLDRGSLIFVTGQIPLDPEGNLVGENDAGKQTEYVFEEEIANKQPPSTTESYNYSADKPDMGTCQLLVQYSDTGATICDLG